LEETAARRQIELENARLADIAERLRLAEAGEPTTSPEQAEHAEQTEQIVAVEAVPPPVAVVDSPTTPASAPTPAASRTGGPLLTGQLPLQALLVAATVFGVIALYQNRSEVTPFSELSSGGGIDTCVWILTLAVAVPLLLGHRPVDQKLVLIGVAASAFFFEFLQASAVVRYGTTGYDERTRLVLKVLQTICLVGAIWMVRHAANPSLPSPPWLRAVLVALAAACGVLLIAALRDQFTEAGVLVNNGLLKDRTSFPVWLIFLGLGPVGLSLALATRPSYGARVALATIATLAVAGYWAEALVVDEIFDVNGSLWAWTAAAHVPLAVVAWWTVAAAPRRHEPAGSLDAA
jgi:hypothetical protein